MNNKNQCFFITYDVKLKNYLSSKNIKDIIYGLNPKTNRLFWVYERNNELNKCLDEWFQ